MKNLTLTSAVALSLAAWAAPALAEPCPTDGMPHVPCCTAGPPLQCTAAPSTGVSAMGSQGVRPGPGNACPTQGGFHSLSSTHPPTGVFITYDGGNLDYVRQMADIMRRTQPSIPLTVLVESHGGYTRSTGPDSNRLARAEAALRPIVAGAAPLLMNLLPVAPGTGTQDPTALWAQDHGLYDGVMAGGNTPTFFDLPYSRADDVPQQIASACALPIVQMPESTAANLPGGDQGGNFGGNIEGFPGDTLVVGNTISNELRAALARQSAVSDAPGGGLVNVQTDWLEVGHADEAYNVVPTGDPAPCNFAVLYASPALGLNLARAAVASGACGGSSPPEQCYLEPPRNPPAQRPRPWVSGSSCLDGLPTVGYAGGSRLTVDDALGCQDFVDANNAYEAIIQRDVAKIRDEVQRRTGCTAVRTLPVPTTYRPDGAGGRNGWGNSDDYSSAVNPNPVNGLVLNRTMVVPRQSNPLFANAVQQTLGSVGVSAEFIDDTYYHFNVGEVHCSSQALRTCTTGGR
ncbi:MAG TPA: protein-arginine deiminase family protein [Bdellovibrionota bacterium]|nr:protein-arginine deiminase family protein [Bdellovibrionota bacterium]